MDSSMKKSEVVVKSEEREVVTFTTIRYGKCHRNHLVSTGGYAIDGCMEFMASGAEGTSAALTCHACGCHRNFHKKEVATEVVCESSIAPPNGAS